MLVGAKVRSAIDYGVTGWAVAGYSSAQSMIGYVNGQ